MSYYINAPSNIRQLASSQLLVDSITPISSSITVNLNSGQSLSIGSTIFTTQSLDVGEASIYAKYFQAGAAFIGYLNGNADSATTATSATSAMTAQTASYVSSNTLQNTISSGSLFLINNNTLVSGTFKVQVNTATNQNQPSLEVNSSGVLIIGKFNTPPTAVSGGIYFDGTDFYFGI